MTGLAGLNPIRNQQEMPWQRNAVNVWFGLADRYGSQGWHGRKSLLLVDSGVGGGGGLFAEGHCLKSQQVGCVSIAVVVNSSSSWRKDEQYLTPS